MYMGCGNIEGWEHQAGGEMNKIITNLCLHIFPFYGYKQNRHWDEDLYNIYIYK